jgi:hypothetical protein
VAKTKAHAIVVVFYSNRVPVMTTWKVSRGRLGKKSVQLISSCNRHVTPMLAHWRTVAACVWLAFLIRPAVEGSGMLVEAVKTGRLRVWVASALDDTPLIPYTFPLSKATRSRITRHQPSLCLPICLHEGRHSSPSL